MIQAPPSGSSTATRPDEARAQLAAADCRLVMAGATLAQLVTLGPCQLLDDETLVRTRALVTDLAAQLADADAALIAPVRDMLAASPTILTHCHALAIEWRLGAVMAARRGLDPVLPPLLRRRLDGRAFGDDAAALATALLAAQTRVGEALRRMRLPFDELPGDLQHMAVAIADGARADHGHGDALPARVSGGTHPDRGRLALLRRVLAGLGADSGAGLNLDQAGVPLFLSALALASGAQRDAVVLATAEDDPIRLALLLRAGGLSRDHAAEHLLAIRPDADPALVDQALTAAPTQAGPDGGAQ
ncbi:hypothetical protein [Novosphingobium sp.]|uniref:hypothetical protein n=1 Tax=Novosphingobium sp. TaxID=1874826 RepID=UPI00333E592D